MLIKLYSQNGQQAALGLGVIVSEFCSTAAGTKHEKPMSRRVTLHFSRWQGWRKQRGGFQYESQSLQPGQVLHTSACFSFFIWGFSPWQWLHGTHFRTRSSGQFLFRWLLSSLTIKTKVDSQQVWCQLLLLAQRNSYLGGVEKPCPYSQVKQTEVA